MADSPTSRVASLDGAFIQQAYDEACALLVEARDYIASVAGEESRALAPDDRLRLTLEMSRLTRRLTDATAWLLLQKGVAAGEITAEQAGTAEAATLDADADDGLDEAALARLPLVARGLMDRARRLYTRVTGLRASLTPPA